jgi:hypothetical protein
MWCSWLLEEIDPGLEAPDPNPHDYGVDRGDDDDAYRDREDVQAAT